MSEGAPEQLDRRSDFRLALLALIGERRARLLRHPGAEDLACYHRRELGAAAAGRLRDHLALCPACCDLVLRLGDGSRPPPR